MARVLVVDDNEDVLDMTARVLAEAGHDVTAADSAERARHCLHQGRYDAAVIDYVMPEEDGLSLAHFLRGRGVAVLMITGAVTFDACASGAKIATARAKNRTDNIMAEPSPEQADAERSPQT